MDIVSILTYFMIGISVLRILIAVFDNEEKTVIDRSGTYRTLVALISAAQVWYFIQILELLKGVN